MDVCSGRPDRAVSSADNGKFSGSKSRNDESGKEFKSGISALQVAPKSAVQIGGFVILPIAKAMAIRQELVCQKRKLPNWAPRLSQLF